MIVYQAKVLLIIVILSQVQAGQIRMLGTNCNQVDSSGNCTSCYPRNVLINGNCVAVSDLCKTWDESTGLCTTCYDGYVLETGVCGVSPTYPTNT